MAKTARIVAQGDEITTGATLDTNSAWLAERLFDRGIRVLGTASAPDDLDLLARLLLDSSRDCDLLISTGGLGPTTDDVTTEAVGKALGVPLEERAEALEQIRARFRVIGRPMTPSNRKQALLPRGTALLENPAGTAPGFAVDLGRARAFFFPGPPHELHVMADRHLFPWLQEQGSAPLLRRRFHVCGVGESVLQDRLADLALPAGVRLGYKTWLPFNSILLYGETDAAEPLARAAIEVRARLGEDLLGEDDETLPQVVGRLLLARGWTMALAESCTAGGAAALATEVPGSSAWFKGGVVAYSNDVKTGLLGVPATLLAEHGAVSEECAGAMAEAVRRAAAADVGVSITGIAGPDGGSPQKPVGLVCFGLALPHATSTRTVRFGIRGRDRVRSMAAATALEWLRRKLVARSP
ncbi:MAG: CinA family nicotinamide mononucleotide deamidase-related protein [Deltaproteobacteria bacterium]|nr:CinA family nicotinamide mononucleotide deamidase-related protein [Deltaproteobacteria bacterium]